MSINRFFRIVIIILLLISNISCDQISKSVVRQQMEYGQQVLFLKDHLTLTKVENTGAFLSLGAAMPQWLKILVLIILPVTALLTGIIYVIAKKNLSMLSMVGACFVVGGGIGNIYDRIVYSSVTDFLHIDFVIFKTGVFNMADVSVMVGATMIVLDSIINSKNSVFEYKH